MAIDDTESCGSRSMDSCSTSPWQQRQKLQVFHEVLRRLKDLNNEETNLPGFDDDLWSHFNKLPTRYALDVNVERAEDVVTHKRLLQLAHDPTNSHALEVRLVQVLLCCGSSLWVSSGSLVKGLAVVPRVEGSNPTHIKIIIPFLKKNVVDQDFQL